MLTRASRRQAREHLRRHLAAAYLEQLSLPWLSTSHPQALDFRRRSSNVHHPPQRHRSPSPGRSHPRPHAHPHTCSQTSHHASSRPLTRPAPSRHLATEAIGYGYSDANSDIPFEGIYPRQQERSNRYTTPPDWGWTGIKPLNEGGIVIMNPTAEVAAPQVRKSDKLHLPGDTALLHENLYALVKVGRFAQAERVVRRLAQIYQPDSPELLDAHHRYLTGRLESILDQPSKETYSVMQRWFELDLRGRDSMPNSSILAILIKASLAVLEGSRLDRTIRRYITIAEQLGKETEYDTIASGLFVDAEVAKIMRLFPEEFKAPPEIISEQDIEEKVEALTRSKERNEHHALPTDTDRQPEELRPVELKGLGLTALKRSLASLGVKEEDDIVAQEEGKSQAYLRQERLERDVIESAMSRWREEAESASEMRARGKLQDPMLGSYVYEWIQEMAKTVKQDLKKAEDVEEDEHVSSVDEERMLLGPFINMCDVEKLCAATVIEYMNYVFDPKEATVLDRPMVQMITKIGTTLWKEVETEGAKRSILEKFHSLPSSARQRKVADMLKNQTPYARSLAGKQYLEESSVTSSPFGQSGLSTLRVKLGAMFLSLFMKIAKLPVSKTVNGEKFTQVQPITIQAMRWRNGKRLGVLKTNQSLVDRLKKEPVGSFIAKHLPMITEPRPWTSLDEGAYLHTKLRAVRFRDSSRSQQEYIQTATQRGDMKQTYAGLDVIGKVPWRINRAVFDVLAQAWNTGEAIGGIAPENPPENWPEKPPEEDVAAIRRWKSLVKAAQNERIGYHSQRCYQNFQLEVARAFLSDTFYCPHSVDFRGRAYPIPPYFNHMGADHVRGLFLFAQGKELGEVGLKWLKIHLANVYGFDKASLVDREEFAMEHLADVYDSASNPLGGKQWWLTAEDPWQCLAACIEIRNALESPQPSKYISHLPVHQDGTCNGLQHYAALGGDIIGAQQVNLMPGDRPADIYSAVADMVKSYVQTDAEAGNRAAQILNGRITRKVVKQPVMTNVYGVTYHGARAQVRKQLLDILPKASLDNDIHHGQLAAYVASLIFKALSRMFTGAHAIQNWLGTCGSIISSAITPEQVARVKARRAGTLEDPQPLKKSRNKTSVKNLPKEDYQFKSTIVWTTPLGMPVVQPYRAAGHRSIRTTLQDLHIADSSASDPVSKRKQLQAFPPNFIHSLDATHMMLSALKCDEIGLQFSSVHDSFWTHASDIPVMNRVLRDAFIRMHSEDVIGRLREEFRARYKGCLTYSPIDARSSLAKKIQALRRGKGGERTFLSGVVREGVQVDELLEESERQRLLNSENEADREKGREMVTPASLYEEEGAAASQHHVAEEGGVQLLGHETSSPSSIALTGQGEAAEEEEDDTLTTIEEGADDGETELEAGSGYDVPGLLEADTYEEAGERDMAYADKEADKVEARVRSETEQSATKEHSLETKEHSLETKEHSLETNKQSLEKTEQSVISPDTSTSASTTTPTKQRKRPGRKPKNPVEPMSSTTSTSSSTSPSPSTATTNTADPTSKPAQKNQPGRNRLNLWLPIAFPAAPLRGEFDVGMLKESQYFFS